MEDSHKSFLFFTSGTLLLIIALLFIPMQNDVKDVSIEAEITQPVVSSPKIFTASATSHPSTILSLGSIWDIVDKIDNAATGNELTLSASCGGQTTNMKIEPIYKTQSEHVNMKIKSVPKEATTVTLKLYDGNTMKDTKEVIIHED